MRSIGKTMRNSLPAIGLGLMGMVGMVGVSAIAAPAAVAQKSSEAFVNNFMEAKKLLDAKQYAQALPKLDAAGAEAKAQNEKAAVAAGRVLAYAGTNNQQKLIEAIDAHRALGGNAPQYDEMLLNAYDKTKQTAKAVEMGKKLIQSGKADHRVYGFIASKSLEAKNYADATTYANQAIAKAGGKPPKDYYNILLKAYLDQKKMDEYYASLEKAAILFNDPVTYWKPFIEAARKQPKFKESVYNVDLYRAFDAANVKLSDADKGTWGESAMSRGVALEAEKIYAPLIKEGKLGGEGDPRGERTKRLWAQIQTNAKADKAGGLAKNEADAATKPTGVTYITIGESYLATGDNAKAIDMFNKGLAKGAMEPGDTDYAKLKLGIAQFKSGKKDDARKTWAEVKSDNGSAWLARVYTALSKV
jgi:hypothetical protein